MTDCETEKAPDDEGEADTEAEAEEDPPPEDAEALVWLAAWLPLTLALAEAELDADAAEDDCVLLAVGTSPDRSAAWTDAASDARASCARRAVSIRYWLSSSSPAYCQELQNAWTHGW